MIFLLTNTTGRGLRQPSTEYFFHLSASNTLIRLDTLRYVWPVRKGVLQYIYLDPPSSIQEQQGLDDPGFVLKLEVAVCQTCEGAYQELRSASFIYGR